MEVDSSSSMENDQDPHTTTSTSSSPTEKEGVAEQLSRPSSPGPRCAPTYTVVNAIIEKKEDGPGPRCGHTLTAVPPVGEEGTPGYIGPRLILFGGATALEGNSASAGTPSSAGSAGISMFILCFIYLFSFSVYFVGRSFSLTGFSFYMETVARFLLYHPI